MNAVAEHDQIRGYACRIVDDSCSRLGLATPLPGLGVAVTEAREQVFQACSSGKPIGPPSQLIVNTWAQAWPEHTQAILGMLQRIYDDLREQHA